MESFLPVALNARLLSPLGEAGPVDWHLKFPFVRLASHVVSKERARWEALKGIRINWGFQPVTGQFEMFLAALPNNRFEADAVTGRYRNRASVARAAQPKR